MTIGIETSMEATLGMHWGGANRQDLHRFLKISAALHALGLLLLIFIPTPPKLAPPGVITVDLVASSSLVAGRPGPSAPKPKPKPPKQVPKILPTEPTTPEPSAQPKPTPPEEKVPEEEELEDYTDILAELRSELGEPDVVPEDEPVQTASLGGGVGSGRPVSPVVAAWMKATRIHIRRFWVVPPGFRNQSLETVIEVELDSGGGVRGEPEVVRRSGNPWYDDGVVRSIRKASPLPAPPEAGRWTFVLISDEI